MKAYQVFVFGDQTGSFASGLQQLVLNKNNPFLVSFFERVHLALRQEAAKLTPSEKKLLPQVANIQELITKYQKGHKNVVLESVLSCLYQLCCFIK